MENFWKDKKILVTGGSGFLGSHVVEVMRSRGVRSGQVFAPRSDELDLRKLENCEKVVAGQDIVIHLAAKVGGIGFLKERPGEVFYDNAIMGIQMMEAARMAGVKKFVAIGTSCAYPRLTPTPFHEDDFWNGYPEGANAPYGMAKKMLLVQAGSYRAQYGFNAIFLMPTNLYGPRDNFDLASSHVVPALIRKVVEAKEAGKHAVEVWGSGQATRDFFYAGDAAEGIVLATEKYNGGEPVNLGSGREVPIRELVEIIADIAGYTGDIKWDASKPDGQPRRVLDISRAKELIGFEPCTPLEDGLKITIQWYQKYGRH